MMLVSRGLRTASLGAAGSACLFVAGCFVVRTPERDPTVSSDVADLRRSSVADAPGAALNRTTLDGLNTAYADRYAATMFSACELLEQDNPSLEQRRMAHLFMTIATTDVYDIVTNADPFTQLLDLVLVVTLQSHVWIDEARADDVFGDRADILVKALRKCRDEIWKMAAKVMSSEDMDLMERLIWDWRAENRDVTYVSFVRFDNFAASRGKSTITSIGSRTGLLAPVDAATRAADEIRLLGERTFYLAKRAPILLNWHTEALLNEVLLKPETQQSLGAMQKASDSLERATESIEQLPARMTEQREAIIAALDERQGAISTTVSELKEAISEGEKLSADVVKTAEIAERIVVEMRETGKALEGVISAADKLISGPERPSGIGPPGEAFEIEEYRRAAEELTGTLRELNTVIASTNSLLESPVWTKRLEEVSDAADQRVQNAAGQSTVVIDYLYKRAMILLVMFFVLLAVYTGVGALLRRRAATGTGGGR